MAVATLLGTADYAASWSPNTGTRWEALNADDADTTYISPNSVADVYCVSEMQDLPGNALNVVSPVVGAYRAKSVGTMDGWVRGALYSNSAYQLGTTHGSIAGAYALYSDNFATASGAAAWTVALVNGAKFGVYGDMDAGQDNNCYVTYRYLTVTYTLRAGGIIPILYQLLPPIIGAALIAREWASIRTLLASRKWVRPGFGTARFSDTEWAGLVRASGEYRHPSYYCFG